MATARRGVSVAQIATAKKGRPASPGVWALVLSKFYATGNLLSFDVSGRLGELRLPVLFIVGRYDEARPETMA